VHLCDAHYITDASKYISVLLLSLRAMLHLELPHINVLSKIDIISQYGPLGRKLQNFYQTFLIKSLSIEFNLDFYTEVQDLNYLETSLNNSLPPRFAALNMAMIALIEDFPYVGFETLAVEVNMTLVYEFLANRFFLR
jgi:GPN-loop GTPase